MRSLVSGFLDNSLSRRGFIRSMMASGVTLQSATSVINSLEESADDVILENGNYRTVTGTGGDLLVQQIKDAGVKYVFTNTGSYEVGFFDAMVRDPELQLILGLHEGVVVSMADGYHRITREPAFVNVHVVAGTAQMAGQVYNAHKDCSSLIITAGLLDNELFSDELFLAPAPGFDQKDINRQFTKISWEVKSAESIPVMTRRGFKVAATQPGGPVYIAYANYALEKKEVTGEIVPGKNFMISSKVKGDPDLIQKTAEKLIHAENPVVLFGDEVWQSGARNKAVELCELLALPAASDREAYRNFPTHHPLCIGRYRPGTKFLDREIDLIASFGSKDFGRYDIDSIGSVPSLIRCGINTADIGRNFPFDTAVVGNTKEIISDVIDSVKSILTKDRIKRIRDSRYNDIAGFTSAKREKALNDARKNFNTSPIHPDRLGYELNRLLEDNAVIVSENFGGRYNLFNLGLRNTETMWMFNTGFSLGWGVGAAMGAKLGAPDRQVVLSIGDGSVMYSASGFWTQARYGIPVINIVWNNKNYQTVRNSFHRSGGTMAETGKYAGIYLGDPDIDFVKLAESQGVAGEKVVSASEIEPALKRAIKSTADGKPYLLDVLVSRTGNGADSTWYQKFDLASTRKRDV